MMIGILILEIKKKLDEVRRKIYSLECGDDYLFSNRNGNLSLYDSLKETERNLQEKLNEYSVEKPNKD